MMKMYLYSDNDLNTWFRFKKDLASEYLNVTLTLEEKKKLYNNI